MRHIVALVAMGLLASTAAHAQNAQQTQPDQNQGTEHQSQATGTQGSQMLATPFVRQIQLRLRAEGDYEGNPTGTWNDETAKALRDFQEANNIHPTGQLDGKTLIVLMRPPSAEQQGTEEEGSSAPAPGARLSPGSMMMMRNPVVRSYESGYQQGFQEGLRWAQQQQEEGQ